MGRILKGLAVAVLSLIAIAACLLFAGFSLCAVNGGFLVEADRLTMTACALVSLAALVGLILLIRKLIREHTW
jgi:hypothetical protein